MKLKIPTKGTKIARVFTYIFGERDFTASRGIIRRPGQYKVGFVEAGTGN